MMPENIQKSLEPLLSVLRELDGYFVFKDAEGNNYILGRVEDVLEEETDEVQLPLPSAPAEKQSFVVRTTADELLDRINREIALFQLQQDEAEEFGEHEIDDLAVPEEAPKRIRFEPLRGDLPPELQE